MTPSTAPDLRAGTARPGAFCRVRGNLCVLRKRASFLAAARARREGRPGMMVQGRDRHDGDPVIRVGFTCSKKVGNAVARNRAKRRLRAVAREVLHEAGQPGWDYVLVGRAGQTGTRPYPALRDDLLQALHRLRSPR
jgi:ribonuclease P protein component